MKMKLPELILSSNPTIRNSQISGRLYFWGAALPVIAGAFQISSQIDKFPSLPKIVTCIICGLSAGVVTLKAYQDKSHVPLQTTDVVDVINTPVSGSNG